MDHLQYKKLINIAKHRMGGSYDPIHDLAHVRRVVAHLDKLLVHFELTKDQQEATVLAAWWHDVARTIVKRPSFLLMPFVDDLISGLLLWRHAKKLGCLHQNSVRLAITTVCCKSLGTGRVLTHLFLKKKDRILVDLLKDADALDLLDVERTKKTWKLVEESWMHAFGYKVIVWWLLSQEYIEMKTDIATEKLIEIVKHFIELLHEQEVYDWHVHRFGEKWVIKQLEQADVFLRSLEQEYSLAA